MMLFNYGASFGDFGVPEIEYFFDGLYFFFIFDGEWEFFVGGVDYAAGSFFPLGEEAWLSFNFDFEVEFFSEAGPIGVGLLFFFAVGGPAGGFDAFLVAIL